MDLADSRHRWTVWALGTAMSRIALAFRSLRTQPPIPALRPIYLALSSEPELRGTAIVALADRLADVINTLDAIVRDRLPA